MWLTRTKLTLQSEVAEVTELAAVELEADVKILDARSLGRCSTCRRGFESRERSGICCDLHIRRFGYDRFGQGRVQGTDQ